MLVIIHILVIFFDTGTSMSAPIVAGAALLVREYFVRGFFPTGAATRANSLEPSAALVKAMIVNSAQKLDNYEWPGFEQVTSNR